MTSIVCAVISARILSSQKAYCALESRKSRYGTIDGLRGYLAIFVFIHHFFVTLIWKSSGEWLPPESVFADNLGRVPVAVFFLITGFLFTKKICKSLTLRNWSCLYESRFFRIYPLYLYVLAVMSVYSILQVNTQLEFSAIVKEYVRYLAFRGEILLGNPDAKNIIARVDWTLIYEWIFYCSLPCLYWLHRMSSKVALELALIPALFFNLYPAVIPFLGINSGHLIYFIVGGIFAKHAEKFKRNQRTHYSRSFLALITLALAMFCPHSIKLVPVLLVSVFFYFILCGENLFGMLSRKESLVLGEISYSIYLTHGIVLYFFYTTPGFIKFDSIMRDFNLPLLTILVVISSSITFVCIESPGIRLGRKYYLTHVLDKILPGKSL